MGTPFYYRGFNVAEIDNDGFVQPVVSIDLDVENITTSTSLGTVPVDANGIVAEGSFNEASGDVIEFSHGSYPLKFRQTLTDTQDQAYLHPDNNVVTYILENSYASTTEVETAELYAQDLDDMAQRPQLLGTVKAGVTTPIPFQTSVGKNLRLMLVSKDSSGAQDIADFSYAQSEDVSIPALAPGTVTSVGMTVPTFLSVSGSPITGSGTFAVSLVSQAAKHFLASPSGSSGVPSMRTIAPADLGTGTPSSSNFLRGDGSWQSISTGITIGSTAISSGTNGEFLYQASGVVSQTPRLSYDGTSIVVGDTVSRTSTDIVFKVQADGGFGNFTIFEQKAAGDVVFRDRFAVATLSYNVSTEIWSSPKTFEIAEIRSSSRYLTPKLVGYNDNNRELNIDQTGIAFRLTDASNNAKLLQMYSTAATAQLEVGYNTSNYGQWKVGSTGINEFNAVGSGAKFVFSDAVEVANGGIFGPMIVDTASVYIDGPGGVYFDNDMTPRVALGDWNANGQGTQLIVDDNDQTISRNVGTGGEFAYIGGKLFQHFVDETTAGTTQENLYTYTLPAGSLTQNGDTIKCEYGGIFTANTNTKRIFPKFAGVVLATGQVAAAGATDWTVDFYLIRVSNTVVRYVVEFTSTGETPTIESGELTGLNLTTTAYNIDLDGRTVTSAGELTAQSGKAIFHPAAA